MTKTKQIRRNTKLERAIKHFIGANEAVKNAYFWSGGNASQRQYTEQNRSASLHFTFEGRCYDYDLVVSCSRANVYVTRKYFVDGQKKTIRELKKLIKK